MGKLQYTFPVHVTGGRYASLLPFAEAYLLRFRKILYALKALQGAFDLPETSNSVTFIVLGDSGHGPFWQTVCLFPYFLPVEATMYLMIKRSLGDIVCIVIMKKMGDRYLKFDLLSKFMQ